MEKTVASPRSPHPARRTPRSDASDRARRERDWADRSPEDGPAEGYEPTYRDGSVKHECWHDQQP